jgi:NADH-quinone oxidoreductase subunit D
MFLNLGPQHPGTHGVLRVVLELEGEMVVSATPHIGYLHRGYEKIGEDRTYHQYIPYTDRLDYLAPLSNNTGYVMAVEKLLGIDVPERTKYIRVICCELARISAHLLGLGIMALDLGAFTVFLWGFKERERLYDIFEKLTGTRLTNSYMRVGGVARDLYEGFEGDVKTFLQNFPASLQEMEGLLTRNKIWLDRCRGVGVISARDAVQYGMTGPNLRAAGVEHDLRKADPYLVYDRFDFDIPVGESGDSMDRYLVRMEEMRQSTRIVEQALRGLPSGPVNADLPKIVLPPREEMKGGMEQLIHHFKLMSQGFEPPVGEVYSAIENPKGELGFYIVSDGEPKAYRMKIRSPSMLNLQAISHMVVGRMVADVITVIGSIDIVMGEVDK